jgi:hypothetical protein
MSIEPDSRYARAETVPAPTHLYDANGKAEKALDDDGKILDRSAVDVRDTLYLLTTLPLPDPPELQIMVREDENITLLAHKALRDPRKWWLVADANPQIRHPLDLKATDVVYLPT